MSTDPFFQQQQAIEKARAEAARLANMAGSDKKEREMEINSSNEDHEENHELQDEQIQGSNNNENDELNSGDDDNENEVEEVDDNDKNKRNKDKVKRDDKKGNGKGKKINKQGRSIKGKNGNNKNGKRGGDGSVRTRIRSDTDLDMFDELEDDVLGNGNKNERKFNVRRSGGRKRNYIESDRRFDVLTDRLAAGDLERDDYIAIVKALGNGNGENTSKGGKKMAKKKGKHGTFVCYLLYFYFHSE